MTILIRPKKRKPAIPFGRFIFVVALVFALAVIIFTLASGTD